MYDYLIVGAGLFGAVFAREATDRGKTCMVIDKRDHIAGNAYTREVNGIPVHQYGAHIFHTSDRAVWEYVNRFAEFNNYINSPLAVYGDEVYNLPFNMNTFSKMWGVRTPDEAKAIIAEQVAAANLSGEPKNLEEQALSLVGRDIYEKLIKGYTEKQWNRDCKDLPAFIIRRLPLRFTYDNNYFSDRWQGIPVNGYTPLVEKLLLGSDVRLNTDYFALGAQAKKLARQTVFTGLIDQYFDYCYGPLEYRSLRFEHSYLADCDNFQGNAVINYTERAVPYTRMIEHKHFVFGGQKGTAITTEYPCDQKSGMEPYYPVNNRENDALYKRYAALAAGEDAVIFGGRLGMYRYFNMDEVIAAALALSHTS